MIALLVPDILPAAELADLRIDITEAEILADLTWPGLPPGRWPVRSGAPAVSEEESRVR
jgi:hypothetical protein